MPHCCSDHEEDRHDEDQENKNHEHNEAVRETKLGRLKNPWMVTSVSLLGLLIFTQLIDINVKPSSTLSNILGRKTTVDTTTTNSRREFDIETIRERVVPKDGFTLPIKWGDLGPRVVKVGAIDLDKFKSVFSRSKTPLSEKYIKILTVGSDENITINFDNSRFIVNFFWALGLAQKSKILDEGPMRAGQTPTENFASTGGWNLGKVKTMDFYSKHQIVRLTTEQEKLVEEITKNVYRTCC